MRMIGFLGCRGRRARPAGTCVPSAIRIQRSLLLRLLHAGRRWRARHIGIPGLRQSGRREHRGNRSADHRASRQREPQRRHAGVRTGPLPVHRRRRRRVRQRSAEQRAEPRRAARQDPARTLSRLTTTDSCTYAIAPAEATVAKAGGAGSIAVTTGDGCAWAAASSDAWITLGATTRGTGNGTVTYAVAPYTGKPKTRTATLDVAGRTFTVTQTKLRLLVRRSGS